MASFPFSFASSITNASSTTPDGPPPPQSIKHTPPGSPSVDERVDYTSELLIPMDTPAPVTTHIDLSPTALIETASSLNYRPVRFRTSLVRDLELWVSPPRRKIIPSLTLWRQDNKSYYGRSIPFIYPLRQVRRCANHTHSHGQSITANYTD